MAAATLAVYRTSIGKKFLMAITGIIGYLFVIAHMVGNWKIFLGADALNHYSGFLRTDGEPVLPARTLLSILRIVLLAAVIIHVAMAIQLSRQAQTSRPSGYRKKQNIQANFASVTLRWGGTAIFFFLIYHLLHFTFGTVHSDFREMTDNGLVHPEAYHNVIVGFSNPLNVLIYLIAVAALGMHLYHGVWSLFQTLGLNRPHLNSLFRGLAVLSGIGLFLGFAVVPVAVMVGFLK